MNERYIEVTASGYAAKKAAIWFYDIEFNPRSTKNKAENTNDIHYLLLNEVTTLCKQYGIPDEEIYDKDIFEEVVHNMWDGPPEKIHTGVIRVMTANKERVFKAFNELVKSNEAHLYGFKLEENKTFHVPDNEDLRKARRTAYEGARIDAEELAEVMGCKLGVPMEIRQVYFGKVPGNHDASGKKYCDFIQEEGSRKWRPVSVFSGSNPCIFEVRLNVRFELLPL